MWSEPYSQQRPDFRFHFYSPPPPPPPPPLPRFPSLVARRCCGVKEEMIAGYIGRVSFALGGKLMCVRVALDWRK